jgi:hypothetical protein
MSELPKEYARLIAIGIDKSANLSDLNDLTDRGANGKKPLKPWTAAKTVGTIKLIRDFNIKDEESLFKLFQKYSKLSIQVLVDQVYEYQKLFFGHYKYDKNIIFKYAYCCIIINSLRGYSTEDLFVNWAKRKGIKLLNSPAFLDERFHTDRLEIDLNNDLIAFVSIKPFSFSINTLQYSDVYAGLQLLTDITHLPWRIFFKSDDHFKQITINSFNSKEREYICSLSEMYLLEEIQLLKKQLRIKLGLNIQ